MMSRELHEAMIAMSATRKTVREMSPRYPEWKSARKTKGQRDRSLKQRSNRRKAKVSMRR